VRVSEAAIHPTAIVSPDADIGADVTVGPFAIVGPQVSVGPRSSLGARCMLEQNVRLGADCRVGTGSILGGPPQDLKYAGEETWVEVGDGTVIREYCTINRGTVQSRRTSLGTHCLVMTYVHIAHDCHIGERVILANGVQLAGHVTIDAHVTLSGLTAVHQFVKIGAYAFVGGMSRVTKDVPPFTKAVGSPMKLYGLNAVGLQRHGFSAETVAELKKAYRLFFRSGLNITQALERSRTELVPLPEVTTFLKFIEDSGRGVLV
jgi:UDP-N-acetylglucosamine acyltransferase